MSNLDHIRLSDGRLPAFAIPGCYPIVYVTTDAGLLCPDCANGENGSDATTDPNVQDSQSGWLIESYGIHWEGEPEICDHCAAEIESAYGPIEETNDE